MKDWMMIRRYLLLIAFAIAGGEALCQQDPMYSQYMFNMVSINPAYAGSREMLSMTALYRKQWVGVEGAPTTTTFNVDAPIRHQRMALGLNIVNDQIGISKDLMINALYAYRVRFNNMGVLSLGLQAGVNQYNADYSSVNTTTYYGGSSTDKAFAKTESSFFPNAGFGAYYYTERFFASVGVPRLIKNNLRGTNNPSIDFTSFPNRQNRHFFISSGYAFDLNQDWQAKPSVMIKAVKGAPLEGDINFNAWWRSTLGAGVSYRTGDAVVAMLEFKPKKEFHIGYAYDYTTSGFSGTNSGSHEVMLRYEPFAAKMKPKAQARYQPKRGAYGRKNFKNLQSRKKKKKLTRRVNRFRRR